MGTTKKELIQDLWKQPYSADRERIIKRARRGHYHDFDTTIATPKVELVNDLRGAGFSEIAERVIAGAYDDEEPTPAQLAEMRRELGPAAFDALMAKKELN